MTVTRTQSNPPVTVSLVSESDAIASKVQALVDNANVALSEIATQTTVSTVRTICLAEGAIVALFAPRAKEPA